MGQGKYINTSGAAKRSSAMKGNKKMDILEKVDGVITSMNEIKSDIEAYGQSRYAQGRADQAAEQGGSVGFSQEQVDQMIAAAKADLEAQLIAQRQLLDAVPAQIEAAVAEAKANYRQEVLAKIDAQNAEETASEQALKDSI